MSPHRDGAARPWLMVKLRHLHHQVVAAAWLPDEHERLNQNRSSLGSAGEAAEV
jgi:hypothetical protein